MVRIPYGHHPCGMLCMGHPQVRVRVVVVVVVPARMCGDNASGGRFHMGHMPCDSPWLCMSHKWLWEEPLEGPVHHMMG